MTGVIGVVIVVVKECIDNEEGSRGKSAAPLTNTLIDLNKGVIRILVTKIRTLTRVKTGPWTVIM